MKRKIRPGTVAAALRESLPYEWVAQMDAHEAACDHLFNVMQSEAFTLAKELGAKGARFDRAVIREEIYDPVRRCKVFREIEQPVWHLQEGQYHRHPIPPDEPGTAILAGSGGIYDTYPRGENLLPVLVGPANELRFLTRSLALPDEELLPDIYRAWSDDVALTWQHYLKKG